MIDNEYKQLWQQVKNHISLQLQYSKLTLAEKLTLLASRLILVMIAIMLGASVMLILSGALIVALAPGVGETWIACLIVAAIYLVLLLLVFAYRHSLIIDPVTRFITKLLLGNIDDNNTTQSPTE
ncbi:MAG: phage holin family protein [Sodaliphilus pleomorphus]|uniref:phage holin family protein n=1 Tax=Sodaliphilus pleomorphus TaxID=2606626 RepID=UPI00240970E3|nr:phage holin family protein [Sodaliphilus pleomorphus]MDD6474031.1 phage holin family protein [Sodaliphilus pleomorphus]